MITDNTEIEYPRDPHASHERALQWLPTQYLKKLNKKRYRRFLSKGVLKKKHF